MGGLAAGWGGTFKDEITLPGSVAQHALTVLDQRFPESTGSTGTVVFAVGRGSVTAQPAVAASVRRLQAVPGVLAVASPLGADGVGQVSREGRIAFASLQFEPGAQLRGRVQDAVVAAAQPARAAGVEVSWNGPAFDGGPAGFPVGEVIGPVVALIALLWVFRSWAAAGITLLTALVPTGVGLALIVLLARFLTVPTFSPTLALMLGLGAGIDYSLLTGRSAGPHRGDRRRAALAAGRGRRRPCMTLPGRIGAAKAGSPGVPLRRSREHRVSAVPPLGVVLGVVGRAQHFARIE